MARKTMTKEVTKTTVKLGKVVVKDGKPEVVELPNEILIGNVSLEKAHKEMQKKHGEQVTVYGVHPETEKYQMKVEDFIQMAELVEEGQEEQEEA